MNKLFFGWIAGLAALSAIADEPTLSVIDLSNVDASKITAGTTANGVPSAYSKRGPIYAFNGAGLTDGKHRVVANETMFMMDASPTGVFPWYIQVDLGEKKRLDALHLWNFNFFANNGLPGGQSPCPSREEILALRT